MYRLINGFEDYQISFKVNRRIESEYKKRLNLNNTNVKSRRLQIKLSIIIEKVVVLGQISFFR